MQPIYFESGSGLEEAERCDLLSLLTERLYRVAQVHGQIERSELNIFCVYSDDSSITIYGTAQGNRIPWEIEIWGIVEVWSFYTKEVICD